MQLNKFYSENFYFFTRHINEQISKNVLKFKNIAIVYNETSVNDLKNFLIIKKFCKYNNLKLYILDNLKVAYQFNLDGIVLSHTNKGLIFLNKITYKKEFKVIGKVHNQREYYFKIKQNCKNIILSPIFLNKKYNNNQLLGVVKFNLISKHWRENTFAMGGINSSNFKRIKETKAAGVGFNNFINNPEIKKPVLYCIRGRAE
jgi:thiamine monophosphate synthase